MGLHFERLRMLVRRRSIGGWIFVIAAFFWNRLGDWQNIEYLQSKHLFPTALPNMSASTSITITLFCVGVVWLTAVLVWPSRQYAKTAPETEGATQPNTESSNPRLALIRERQRLEDELLPLVEIEEGAIQVHPKIMLVPDESDYRKQKIAQIRRDIADIDRHLGSPSIPSAAARYSQPKQLKPNLQPDPPRAATLSLESGVWTDKPLKPNHSVYAILIDFINAPNQGGPIGFADDVRACVQVPDKSHPLCPLWWLYHQTNSVSISPATKKTIVLAIGPLLGMYDERPWCFPLNLKEETPPSYGAPDGPVVIDHRPISAHEFLFDLFLVDVASGNTLGKWKYRWEMHGSGPVALPSVTFVA